MTTVVCPVCGASFEKRNWRHTYCTKTCQSLAYYRPAAEAVLDLVARDGGATGVELSKAVARLGYPRAGDARYVVRLLRVMFGDNVIIIEDGRYRLPPSGAQALRWVAKLATRRLHELDNVIAYAERCADLYSPQPERSRLWAVVVDDLRAARRHFAFATEVDALA